MFKVRARRKSHELIKFQLYSLEDVGLQEGIKGFADKSQGEYATLVASAELHIVDEDRFEQFAGQGIHGDRWGSAIAGV